MEMNFCFGPNKPSPQDLQRPTAGQIDQTLRGRDPAFDRSRLLAVSNALLGASDFPSPRPEVGQV